MLNQKFLLDFNAILTFVLVLSDILPTKTDQLASLLECLSQTYERHDAHKKYCKVAAL